jgi:hypothetical protein
MRPSDPRNAVAEMRALLEKGVAVAPVPLAGGVLGLRASSSYKAANSGVFGEDLIEVNGLNRVKIRPFLLRLGIEL